MARFRTLANMILDVRHQANQEQPGTADADRFITDAEITEWLNQGIAELETRLSLVQGQPHFRASQSYSVAPPTTLYTLPAAFLSVQEVNVIVNGLTMFVQPFMPSERATLTTQSAWPIFDGIRYRIQAGNIEFLPATQSYSAVLYYTPNTTRLVSPSDAWDGFNGYEMAPIYNACARCAAKEESDPGFFLSERDRIYSIVEKAAAQRDMSNPERIQDVMSVPGTFGWWMR